MKIKKQAKGDALCPHCQSRFYWDEGRRCYRCDRNVCPGCITIASRPLCPECQDNLPADIKPMLAVLAPMPRTQKDWSFEYKWDGIRAIFYLTVKTLRIESRNLIDITRRYPEFADLPHTLERNMVLDGEIVVLDENGTPSFSLLQKRMSLDHQKAKKALLNIRAYYFIFDLLHLGNDSMMEMTYLERRKILQAMNIRHPWCQVPPSHVNQANAMIKVAKERALEGLVAKKNDSPYLPGHRSQNWRKIKIVSRQEFVIGGWKPLNNDPRGIGSLMLGYHENGIKLNYAGSVGTGFDWKDQATIRPMLENIETSQNPFTTSVPHKGVRFVKPTLVAEVEFRRWPEGGLLQQASFKGLRYDKTAAEVGKEKTFDKIIHGGGNL